MRKFFVTVGKVLLFLLLFLFILLCLTYFWTIRNWADLTVDEIIFQLTAPLTGTGSGILAGFFLTSLIPAVLLTLGLIGVYLFLYKKVKKWHRVFLGVITVLIAAVFGLCLSAAVARFDVITYLKNNSVSSSWIEENYVDPSETTITFPETKRNLIYIYLESMEVTYADEESGGAFSDNYIPNLTALAETFEDFSGNSNLLNGGYAMSGGTWTAGALISETSGLPLKASTNSLDRLTSIYPSVVTLGDILEDAGYQNVFLLGSDATFGGRRLYFTEHGNYEICDYQWAVDEGYISSDYYVWWGYEDEKLFTYAKDKLLSLAEGDEPFNLTMLTVDTHFPDGYVCDLCETSYDTQYANVIACSDEQVSEFVAWIQEQDFYEDTTIVISGDHPTMDADFCDSVEDSYGRKVYTCYINAAVEAEDSTATRTYTTLDAFPTTLAALGCEIEGDRLGLGTNLFSSTATLAEEYGVDELNTELAKKSEFMDTLFDVTWSSSLLNRVVTETLTMKDDGDLKIKLYDAYTGLFDVAGGRIEVTNAATDYSQSYELKSDGEFLYKRFSTEGMQGVVTVDLYLTVDSKEYHLKTLSYNLDWAQYKSSQEDYTAFLNTLDVENYAIFLSTRYSSGGGLTDTLLSNLMSLGVDSSFALQTDFRNSFYCVIDGGEVVSQDFSRNELETSGTLSNGIEYSVLSSGKYIGEDNYITLNGTDYVLGRKGINYVVVDLTSGEVIDCARFYDTADSSTEQ